MNDSKSDVDIEVVGTGCGYSCGFSCLLILVVGLIGGIAGAAAVGRIIGFIAFFGFLAGLAIDVAVGYFTAKAARTKGVAVNLHIFIVGGLIMLLGVLSFAMPQTNKLMPRDTQALRQLLSILSWLSTIPLMLYGASLHADDQSGADGNSPDY